MAAKTSGSTSNRLFKTLLFLPVPLLFLTVSVAQVSITIRDQDLLYAAQRIESGKPVSIDYVGSLLGALTPDDVACRHDIVKAIMTASFHTLDTLNASLRDFDRFQSMVALAESYAEKSLTCFPTDGGLWLQLAVVRWAGNASFREVAIAMTRSQQFAPAETAILLGRLDMWNRMSHAAIKAAEPAARADLSAYFTYFGSTPSKAIQSPSPALASLITSTKRRFPGR